MRNTSGGCQASTRIAAAASDVIACGRLPIAAARQAIQTSSVARTTGVSGLTSSIYSPTLPATSRSARPRGTANACISQNSPAASRPTCSPEIERMWIVPVTRYVREASAERVSRLPRSSAEASPARAGEM